MKTSFDTHVDTGPLNVGVDVASEHLDAAVHERPGMRRLGNADAPIKRWLRTLPVGTRIAMESTGRYHERLARLAHAEGMVVYLLDPRAVRHYAQGLGVRGKTDRIDAQVLARMIEREHGRLRAWQPPSIEEERLKVALRQRGMLSKHKSALRQALLLEGEAAVDYRALFKQVEATLRELDRYIGRAAHALPQGKCALGWITSVPGIGLLTGAALLRVFLRLARRGADAVVAFVGMDLRPWDSGKMTGVRRLSKHGDSYTRKLLHMAAMAAMSHDPRWRALYERERAKGLSSTAALVVLARKLLRVAFALFKQQASYDPARAGSLA